MSKHEGRNIKPREDVGKKSRGIEGIGKGTVEIIREMEEEIGEMRVQL